MIPSGTAVRRRKRRGDIHISRKLHAKGISIIVGSSSSSEGDAKFKLSNLSCVIPSILKYFYFPADEDDEVKVLESSGTLKRRVTEPR